MPFGPALAVVVPVRAFSAAMAASSFFWSLVYSACWALSSRSMRSASFLSAAAS